MKERFSVSLEPLGFAVTDTTTGQQVKGEGSGTFEGFYFAAHKAEDEAKRLNAATLEV